MTGQPTKYNTALYMRLSRDDGVEGDSSSIQTQKEMLTRYCKENGLTIYKEYVDDGFSGVSFDRPSFNRMIADIEDGKVNCVVTKDLSRLGRNYIEAGTYVEMFFPERGVRYIAITDGVDTEKGSSLDITPFKNLLNEMYAKDISNKVRSAIHTRQMQGKFTGAHAPYGYKKDPENKNHLVIDEETAPYVRMIFEMAKNGVGANSIARVLKEQKIPRPANIRAKNGEGYAEFLDESTAYHWEKYTVRNILSNAVYKGAIVVGRQKKLSLKSKKRKRNAYGECVVEGCHEPIVSPENWGLVQELIVSRKRGCERKPETPKYDNIFAGLIKCASCGRSLAVRRSSRKFTGDARHIYDYECNRYRREGKDVCSPHKIRAEELYNAVLGDIQRFAGMALKDEDKLLDVLSKRLTNAEKDKSKQNERDLNKARRRLAEIDRLYSSLYENYVNGKVNERNFTALSANYETEQTELESKIRELSAVVEAESENIKNAEKFIELIKPYSKIRKLTQAILNTLIERIEVREPEMIGNESIQKVDVFYKHVGVIS